MTKYILIPDNISEEEVVLYHLRGPAMFRSDMIRALAQFETLIGRSFNDRTDFAADTNEMLEYKFNSLNLSEFKDYFV